MNITKKSLFRKLSIISLAVLVFVSSLLGANANTANAVGVDTVVKLVGGKAVVRALAEKAGMSLSKKQVDNVAGFIEKKTFDGDEKAIEFANKANNLTSSGSSLKEGFKKYLLDPGAWLLGLDLLFLAVDAFNDGYSGGTPVPLYGQCMPKVLNNVTISAGEAYAMFDIPSKGWRGLWVYNPLKVKVELFTPTSGSAYMRAVSLDGTTQSIKDYYRASGSTGNWTYVQTTTTTATSYGGSGGNLVYSSDYAVCDYPVVAEDIINTTNVPTTVINNFDNDTYNTNTTYNIEIEMPDTINYDDPTPWNEPDPKIEEEVNPVVPPVDTDEDGVPDDTDSDVDKGSWLENLIPIITLIAIFDLLKAVIFYLARMFEFILTIPLIEAKPIDNVAFEWFRNADIVGIEIYSVISLLATIGLSFAVYKVVRRLLP